MLRGYPLLWKELRESRLAIAAGALWILGSGHFWLHWADVKLPKVAAFILIPINLFAAGACILMLSVARSAVERHNGT